MCTANISAFQNYSCTRYQLLINRAWAEVISSQPPVGRISTTWIPVEVFNQCRAWSREFPVVWSGELDPARAERTR
jgi:hypothetical protein